MSAIEKATPGVSGMAVYVPALRVSLEQWCEWTGSPWAKVQNVVGRSFRCCAPDENVYTMAATAVLRLIRRYDIDPGSVGYLALGTETSTDNSAGAVIVRGMVDRALEQLGMPRLARSCEVPELKHACLGGVYGMKGAVRYLAHDGRGRRAIVVCSDIAEYERGSSGEQTQGAGAVATLLEGDPKLYSVDLAHAGSASAYRGPDFRKPHARHLVASYASETRRKHDFPVFSGKYSTFAYLDETLRAVEDAVAKLGTTPMRLFEDVDALFFHRPYHHMPVQAMGYLYLQALVKEAPDGELLTGLLRGADLPRDRLLEELGSTPDLFARVLDGNAEVDPYPTTSAAAGALRKSDAFKSFLATKMSLGAELAMELGNLYTAALFAWIAAGFEEAQSTGRDLTDAFLLTVGYGSGDAAEAIPVRVAPQWREAARKIEFRDALAQAQDLNREQYEALHDGREVDLPRQAADDRFRVARVGDRYEPSFQDLGIEYYEYGSAS